jgi:hypothetical protein
MNDLTNLQADGPLVVLNFETIESSKLTRKFIADAAALLLQGDKKPLVLTSTYGLAAVYRAVPSWAYSLRDNLGRELFGDIGRRFSDVDSNASQLKFTLSDEPSVYAQDGTWAADREPQNTSRHVLPVFNDELASRQLAELVDSWQTDGRIVMIRPVIGTAHEPYASRPNLTKAKDLDPQIAFANRAAAR